MKKYVLLVVAAITLNAQSTDDVIVQEYNTTSLYKDSAKVLVGGSVEWEANSNAAVNNSFVNTIVFKSYIDESEKDGVIKRLRTLNDMALYGNEVFYAKYKLNSTVALTFNIANTDLIRSTFSSDMFKLVFKGNADFAGQTAHLSNSNIDYINYQTISLGLEKKFNRHVLGAGLSYVTVGQYQSYHINRGDLYTAEDGTYLDFTTDISLQSVGTDAKSRYFNNVGAGTALNLSYFHKSESGKLAISANLTDLGFMNINNIESYHKDSSYHFSGISIDNLFDFDMGSFDKYHTDSIYKILNMNKESVSKRQMLPFKLKVGLKYDLSQKVAVLYELQYLHTDQYMPRVTLGGTYKVCERFSAFAKVAAGGFGRVDSYVGFNTLLPLRINLYASLNVLENVLASSKSTGTSLNLGVSRIF